MESLIIELKRELEYKYVLIRLKNIEIEQLSQELFQLIKEQ